MPCRPAESAGGALGAVATCPPIHGAVGWRGSQRLHPEFRRDPFGSLILIVYGCDYALETALLEAPGEDQLARLGCKAPHLRFRSQGAEELKVLRPQSARWNEAANPNWRGPIDDSEQVGTFLIRER
jgi:hypothetical protein